MNKKLIICAVFATILICGCNKSSKNAQNGVISINGEWIKKEEIDKAVELLRNDVTRLFPGQIFEGTSNEMKKQAAKQIVAQKLLLNEAKKMNYSIDTTLVNQNVAAIKKTFKSDDAFAEELQKWGRSEKEFYQEVEHGLMLDTMMKVLLANSDSVTDEECRKFYKENKNEFTEGMKIRVSQIVLTKEKGATDAKIAQQKNMAEDIRRQLTAGADFVSLARKHSQGPAAQSGGDMGWFEKGDMKKEFDSAIGPLKSGEISDIIETDIGFHLFKKTDEQLTAPRSYSEVKKQIAMLISVKKKNEFLIQYVDSLIGASSLEFADTVYAFGK